MKKLLVAVAIMGLAGCAQMKEKMPDWMPGSGAMKVSLTGAEEVPAVSTAAKGSGSFRVAEDGTVTGSAHCRISHNRRRPGSIQLGGGKRSAGGCSTRDQHMIVVRKQ